MSESVGSKESIPPPEATTATLNVDEFLAWMVDRTSSRGLVEMNTAIESITGGDSFRRLWLARDFDQLIGGSAPASSAFYEAVTVRELYLHYLHMDSSS